MVIGYIPSAEDINASESLGKRLKGQSDEETLTNILEWQHTNIRFWGLRGNQVLQIAFISLIFSLVFIITISLRWLFYMSWKGIILNLYLPVLILAVLALAMVYLYLEEELRKDFSLKCGLESLVVPFYAFKPNLNFEQISRYKFGVCRDYAKLTACLLLNSFKGQDPEIYFVPARDHVATGIKLENNIHMLDQRLPIFTIRGWIAFWKPSKRVLATGKKLYKGKLYSFDEREIAVWLKSDDEFTKRSSADKEKMALMLDKKLQSLMKFGGQKVKEYDVLPLKGWAKYYENDHVVDYSIARLLEHMIYNKVYENGINSKLTGIEVALDGVEDLKAILYTM